MVQTEPGNKPKIYFYYPPAGDPVVSGPRVDTRRRVLAGIVEDGKLYVAQSICFGGIAPSMIPVKLRGGSVTYVIDPGVKPDMFNKVEGRNLAIRRLGIYEDPKTGNVVRFKKQPLFEIPLPEGDVNPGKLFVGAVETWLQKNGLPVRVGKERQDMPPAGPPTSSCM